MAASSAMLLSAAAAACSCGDALPPIYQLLPTHAASALILTHLAKHDRQQFALTCKHTRLLAIAAVTRLSLGHKWLSCKQHGTAFPAVSSLALRPRTMDELSKMMAALLLHKAKRLPQLAEMRLDLQGVYDKHCDMSLMLRSIPLHLPQLTVLSVHQGAALTARAVKAMADMPLLAAVTLRSGHGFEPGALAPLAGMPHLTALHLEVAHGCLAGASSSSSPVGSPPGASSSAAASVSSILGGSGSGSGSGTTPSEVARLAASDEVSLSKCGGRLSSFAAVGLGRSPGGTRAVAALLEAASASLRPRLARLVLTDMPELPGSCLESLAGICSLTQVSLAGCDALGCSADLARLSVLTGLTELCVAPGQPPAPSLAALARGCKRLARLGMGAPVGQLAAVVMPGVAELRLAAGSPHGLGSCWPGGNVSGCEGAGSSCGGVGGVTSCLAGMAVAGGGGGGGGGGCGTTLLRGPVQLACVGRVWPGLVSLEVVGWAVDGAGVAALRQLEGLTSLRLQGGGAEPCVALHARPLLPLLELPRLARLALLQLADLTDEWVGEAVRNVSACGGSLAAVRELHLGGLTAALPPAGGGGGCEAAGALLSGTGGSSSVAASGAAMTAAAAAAAAAAAGGGGGKTALSDRGLVRLFACPRLTRLVLVGLPGITLAGVKALVRGSSSLARLELLGCAGLAGLDAAAVSRAAVAAPDRAVDLWVA